MTGFSPSSTGSASVLLETLPSRLDWLFGRGRTRPDEPLYGCQIKDGDETVSQAEHDDPEQCAALAIEGLRVHSCEYCGTGPCENCMNTGLRYPEIDCLPSVAQGCGNPIREALEEWVAQGYIDAEGDHCGAAAYAPALYIKSVAALNQTPTVPRYLPSSDIALARFPGVDQEHLRRAFVEGMCAQYLAVPQHSTAANSSQDTLKMVAGMFSESVHETYTREEVVSIVEDMMHLGSPVSSTPREKYCTSDGRDYCTKATTRPCPRCPAMTSTDRGGK